MGVVLKLSSAISLDGKIVKAGYIVEVDQTLAKSLLHRGKAVLATVEPGDVIGVDVQVSGFIVGENSPVEQPEETQAEQPKRKSKRGE